MAIFTISIAMYLSLYMSVWLLDQQLLVSPSHVQSTWRDVQGSTVSLCFTMFHLSFLAWNPNLCVCVFTSFFNSLAHVSILRKTHQWKSIVMLNVEWIWMCSSNLICAFLWVGKLVELPLLSNLCSKKTKTQIFAGIAVLLQGIPTSKSQRSILAGSAFSVAASCRGRVFLNCQRDLLLNQPMTPN